MSTQNIQTALTESRLFLESQGKPGFGLSHNPRENLAGTFLRDHSDTRIQLFRQRLSNKSVKAFATMPIGIMDRKSLALIGCGSRC